MRGGGAERVTQSPDAADCEGMLIRATGLVTMSYSLQNAGVKYTLLPSPSKPKSSSVREPGIDREGRKGIAKKNIFFSFAFVLRVLRAFAVDFISVGKRFARGDRCVESRAQHTAARQYGHASGRIVRQPDVGSANAAGTVHGDVRISASGVRE